MSNKEILEVQFHNPNSAEKTADYVVKICLEAGCYKLDKLFKKAALEDSTKMYI